jgi:hypothetical protein
MQTTAAATVTGCSPTTRPPDPKKRDHVIAALQHITASVRSRFGNPPPDMLNDEYAIDAEAIIVRLIVASESLVKIWSNIATVSFLTAN